MTPRKTSSYLAFDLGASNCRTVIGTLSGSRISLHEVHRFATPLRERDGSLSWDVEELWREIRRGLERAMREAPDLRSISVDSWAVDYVPLDEAGWPLRDPHCYRDPRTRGRMEQAFQKVPAAELYGRTGIQMLELNSLYQLLADLEEEPGLLWRTAQRLPIADFILYRLCGRAAVERTMASTTQLMDVRTGQWASDLIRRFGLPETGWPEIVPPGTVLGPLVGIAASGAAAPVVVASCSHDTAAAVAAVPADHDGPSWAFLSSGTWSLLGMERSKPVLSEAARAANFTNEAGLDGTIRLLKNLNGMWILQECERQWRAEGAEFDFNTLIAEAAAARPAAGLLDLNDPALTGRGDMPANLRQCCRNAGVAVPTTRGGLVRLVFESLAASYARALRDLESLTGERIEVLHVVGGGSQNKLLCQMTADACGIPVIAGPVEATALGNLLVQARALGELPGTRTIRDVVRASCRLQEYLPSDATAWRAVSKSNVSTTPTVALT
jgi:rhamnulokinase